MSDKKETSPALERSWFKSIKAEFGKITWPSKNQLIKETIVVVVSAVLLGAIIWGVDQVLQYGRGFIFN
ncbi:MAG: preprotein translocase subunit SecE [Eubacterium sp.]|nr:preprotein translocase subunit SecE [Eubacterium sp.]